MEIHAIARFRVTQTDPEFCMYATPVQIDPEKPALPISHPPYYAAYLAARLFEDNTDEWRGDHCIAPRFVPGVLLSNRRRRVHAWRM
jgi:hypothetical protein